jgi:hypothetical protein
VIEIDRLIVDAAGIAPQQGKQFARLLESALQRQLEMGGSPSSFSAKDGVQVNIPAPGPGANVTVQGLAGQVAQAIHRGLARRA